MPWMKLDSSLALAPILGDDADPSKLLRAPEASGT
jgi:hypothetical protein